MAEFPFLFNKYVHNTGQLFEEIQTSNITISIERIDGGSDDTTVIFKADLSGAEYTTLSGLVDDYVTDPNYDPVITEVTMSSERHTGDGKLRVLSSHKPLLSDGRASYNYFAGEGDLIASGTVGGGQSIQLCSVSGTGTVEMDIKFLNCVYPPEEIWIFGGSVMWQNAHIGDTFSLQIRTSPSPVVPRVVATGISLPVDYDLDGDRIKYVGPDAGDYALGGLPVFVPNWDYTGHWDLDSAGTSAVPNFTETGEFDWHTTDQLVGDYMREIPIIGTNTNPTPIDATEAAPIPYGHYIRIVLQCDDDNNETCLIGYLRIYRERLK